MFTIIRPIAALALALLTAIAAQAWWPLYRPDWPVPAGFVITMAVCGLVVGWGFLGARVDRRLWMTVFAALQAVVLTALLATLVFGIREVFVQGYRRRFREPMEAVNGFFDFAASWLALALERDFLVLLAVGALIVGVFVHLLHALFERRRLSR